MLCWEHGAYAGGGVVQGERHVNETMPEAAKRLEHLADFQEKGMDEWRK